MTDSDHMPLDAPISTTVPIVMPRERMRSSAAWLSMATKAMRSLQAIFFSMKRRVFCNPIIFPNGGGTVSDFSVSQNPNPAEFGSLTGYWGVASFPPLTLLHAEYGPESC